MQTKKVAALIAALALAGATTPTVAFAGPPGHDQKGKCNSGNGNQSETACTCGPAPRALRSPCTPDDGPPGYCDFSQPASVLSLLLRQKPVGRLGGGR
jgi:hypothetical protein